MINRRMNTVFIMVNKERIKNIILQELIGGIVSLFISIIPFSFSWYSSLNLNISYFEVLLQIPIYIYILCFVPLIVFIYIRLKMREGKSNTITLLYVVSCKPVCSIIEFDMEWVVVIPKDENDTLIKIYNNFDISPKPKCPNCKVKLDYQDNLLWYTFDCFNCSFKKRTWQNLDRLTNHVKELFKVKLEKIIKEKYN